MQKENFGKYELHLYDIIYLNLRCSVSNIHVTFKIKYNEYYFVKLYETYLIDKVYDFKSYNVLNKIY